MIDNDVRNYLLTQSPVTTLVGTDAAGAMARIYAEERQQNNALDAIVFTRISTDHSHSLASATGWAVATFEFDCCSSTKAGAKALGEALRGELDGFRGTMGSTTVTGCQMDDEHDDFDPPADGSQIGTYHVIQTYAVQFVESVPSF